MSNRPVRDVPLAVRQVGAAALRVRGPVAMTRFLRSEVLAGHGIPHGDGAPVILLPPAAAGDWLMPIMLSWLRRIDYTAYRSSIGLHVDCSDRTMARVLPRVEEIAERHGGKLIVVGHSRGGLLSRAIGAAAASVARNRLQHREPALLSMGCLTEACACSYGRFFRAQSHPTGHPWSRCSPGTTTWCVGSRAWPRARATSRSAGPMSGCSPPATCTRRSRTP